jgi:hypothetical protein
VTDKAVFEAVSAQTKRIHNTARVTKQLGIIQEQLKIEPPVKGGRLWTKAHSLASIQKMGINLSSSDKRTKTAADLQELMMSTFTGLFSFLFFSFLFFFSSLVLFVLSSLEN